MNSTLEKSSQNRSQNRDHTPVTSGEFQSQHEGEVTKQTAVNVIASPYQTADSQAFNINSLPIDEMDLKQ